MTDESKLAHRLTAILSDLIAIPSPHPPGDTREICAYIRKRYEGAGYRCQTLTRAEGVDNVVASTGARREGLTPELSPSAGNNLFVFALPD